MEGKYLKYKTKYLALKNQIGSGRKKKSPIVVTDPCDAIWWLVDILGTMDILQLIINKRNPVALVVENTSDRHVRFSYNGRFANKHILEESNGARGWKQYGLFEGLYFNDGHWHFCHNGDESNSYKLNFQEDGTQHFCQTFALACYVGEQHRFQVGKYMYNVQQCVQFWIDVLSSNSDIVALIMREIKSTRDEFGREIIDLITNKNLKSFTESDLSAVFQYIQREDIANNVAHCI